MLTEAIPIAVSFVIRPTARQIKYPKTTTKMISTNLITQLTNNSLNIIPPCLDIYPTIHISILKPLPLKNTTFYLLLAESIGNSAIFYGVEYREKTCLGDLFRLFSTYVQKEQYYYINAYLIYFCFKRTARIS